MTEFIFPDDLPASHVMRNSCRVPGPKRPGYDLKTLDTSLLGRSRRAEETTVRRPEVIDLSKQILGVPDTWHLGIIPGSDTGAMEAAMWGLLGQRPVDVLDFDGFNHFWAGDVIAQLKVHGSSILKAPPGEIPDLESINWRHGVVLVANATSAGTRIPGDDWIPAGRDGLMICDASSAAFAMHLPWHKLDAVTWSWQKALGGEGAHGMLALSPEIVAAWKRQGATPLTMTPAEFDAFLRKDIKKWAEMAKFSGMIGR